MLALALVLEGASRAEAARAAGMDRQTLRDWVHRYNEEGLAGLSDRLGERGPKPRLSPEQEADLAELVRQGPDLTEHGVVRWRRADLARVIASGSGWCWPSAASATCCAAWGSAAWWPGPATPATTPRRRRLSGATSPPS